MQNYKVKWCKLTKTAFNVQSSFVNTIWIDGACFYALLRYIWTPKEKRKMHGSGCIEHHQTSKKVNALSDPCFFCIRKPYITKQTHIHLICVNKTKNTHTYIYIYIKWQVGIFRENKRKQYSVVIYRLDRLLVLIFATVKPRYWPISNCVAMFNQNRRYKMSR